MRMRAWFGLGALLACHNVDAAAVREQAEVSAAGGGRLLYRETHYVQPGAGRWVLYRSPDGRAFARKRVHASRQPSQPAFDLHDGRDGYREGARGGGATREVYSGRPAALSARAVRGPADGVIDAGFDAAVRANWDALLRGESVRLQFLLPGRQRFFPVRLRHAGSIDWKGMPAERLRMRLDAWFGFAVPAVSLVYARGDRRLL